MKKVLSLVVVLFTAICMLTLAACGVTSENVLPSQETERSAETDYVAAEAAVDTTFDNVTEATDDFSIATEDGDYTSDGGAYTILKGGTYTLSGYLEGQVIIDAPDEEVTLELSGATIVCSTDSPIKATDAEKVEIAAKKDTENVIKDTRSEKTSDDDAKGTGAISAKCDLKLKGNGILVIEANYNNGVHTSKDLTIKNLSLKVTAVNNALKGKKSVTIESGTVVAVSTKGDGIETEDTDVSSKGKQRGTITIADGVVAVYAAGDGVQASYDFVMDGGSLSVYTGSYSSYTAGGAQVDSYKGIKVSNELTVNAGSIAVHSYDDGLHADYGETLENGATGQGNVTVNGGKIEIVVYSPTKSTFGGRMGPMGRGGFGGFGGQQEVTGSDAIHADNTLTVTGGTIVIDSAYEGLEASHIVISGGDISVYATDDGVNACTKITNSPTILVSGGYLFVTVPTSGDTDGIDSNGTYKQTGGVVIACGPGSASGGMGGGAWALDTDRGVTLTGGALILFGGMENTPSISGVTKTVCSSGNVSAGSHTVTVGEESYTVELKYATGGCVVYGAGKATLK